MTTFYICRHGQTLNNQNRRLSGWIDTPLTDEGIQNARTSANKLHDIHIDTIVSSDLGRAFITAYLIAKSLGHELHIVTSKELREVNYGDLGNAPLSTYPKVSPAKNADLIHPNGESLSQMQMRIMTYLKTLSLEYPNKTLLLVAHEGTINAIRASYLHENIGIIDAKYSNPHDFVAKFSYQDDEIVSFEEIQT